MTSARYLMVDASDGLSWNYHTNRIVRKANQWAFYDRKAEYQDRNDTLDYKWLWHHIKGYISVWTCWMRNFRAKVGCCPAARPHKYHFTKLFTDLRQSQCQGPSKHVSNSIHSMTLRQVNPSRNFYKYSFFLGHSPLECPILKRSTMQLALFHRSWLHVVLILF